MFNEEQFLCFLIVFIGLLVCTQIYSFLKVRLFNLREGMEDESTNDSSTNDSSTNDDTKDDTKEKENQDNDFKKYDTDSPENALILAQQNAGNIRSLEQKIETQQAFVQRLDNLESTVENQQTQLDGLVEQQAQYAEDISASEPVEITGMDAD